MGTAPTFVLFYLYFFFVSTTYSATQNFVVPWSTKKYGPDGPWQAVVITAGGNETGPPIQSQGTAELSVYPGGSYESITFAASACDPYPDSLCALGGTWTPDSYQARQQPVSWPANWTDKSTGTRVEGAQHVVLGITINQRTVLNASLASASSGNVTYPNGRVGGVPLGTLALGADKTIQEFGQNPRNVSQKINAYTYAGSLYETQVTPSYSYGLHIGSAAFDYPGSLVFGGYNKGRVIEPVTAFSSEQAVQLMDISIGIASGGSPFNFTSKNKLLSTGQIFIWPDPLAPYMSLPRKTCDNLASVLPVTFDEDLGYYLWNTNDPNFAKIVSSPAYLGFAFPPTPGAADNVIIKVPFALLNLTLEAPITNTPKQYFPCVPTKYENKLGRAFLQAAFIGRNWNTKTSWLAQAPGPGPARQGLGEGQHVDIANEATMIEGFKGDDQFVNSWKGQWSLLDSQHGGGNGSESSGNDTASTSSGLSTGAKAGIGVGAALGAIALLAVFFFWRKRSVRNNALQAPASGTDAQPTMSQQHGKVPTDYYSHQVHYGQNDTETTAELPHTLQDPVELDNTTIPNHRH
jgi:hypothetical protein